MRHLLSPSSCAKMLTRSFHSSDPDMIHCQGYVTSVAEDSGVLPFISRLRHGHQQNVWAFNRFSTHFNLETWSNLLLLLLPLNFRLEWIWLGSTIPDGLEFHIRAKLWVKERLVELQLVSLRDSVIIYNAPWCSDNLFWPSHQTVS